MKTTLPIPAQEGFRIRLPERVTLSAGTVPDRVPQGLRLAHGTTTLEITMPRPASEAFLGELGTGMRTAGLAVTWRQLLERLAAKGMLTDADEPPDDHEVSALAALVEILDRVHRESVATFRPGTKAERFMAGEFVSAAGLIWLTENYHYTKSAGYHVAPVLRHEMDDRERALWQRFLKDESWHWRIYRPALKQFGLSCKMLDSRKPLPATRNFIETLHAIATKSPVAYAAAMIFIEQPPLCTSMSEDPLISTLMGVYGFDHASVTPLWWHATENLTAGHSDLGQVVISNRVMVTRNELDGALVAVAATVTAVNDWYEGMFREF